MDKSNYVWYVSYGSNILFERFNIYLTGNNTSRFKLSNHVKTITDPPLDYRFIEIPYELYFAKKAARWENKGVAFIDPSAPGITYGKAYLITKEQFDSVMKQEGAWYSNKIVLDDIDGIKAMTFTSHERYDYVEPSKTYLNVIKEGLLEKYTKDVIEIYFNKKINNQS